MASLLQRPQCPRGSLVGKRYLPSLSIATLKAVNVNSEIFPLPANADHLSPERRSVRLLLVIGWCRSRCRKVSGRYPAFWPCRLVDAKQKLSNILGPSVYKLGHCRGAVPMGRQMCNGKVQSGTSQAGDIHLFMYRDSATGKRGVRPLVSSEDFATAVLSLPKVLMVV